MTTYQVISYSSNPGYLNMVNRLERLCSSWNIDFRAFDHEFLETSGFVSRHLEIMSESKGGGLWSWKPFIIMTALMDRSHDCVVYMDSSVIPKTRLDIERAIVESDGMSASPTSFKNGEWTKRVCFQRMGCDMERFWNLSQVWAGVVVVKRSGMDMLDLWRNLCLDKSILDDSPCEDNLEGFKYHRHDQSILTNILEMYKQPLFNNNESFEDNVDYSC